MLTAARILLTLAVLGYALVTIKADFNNTHATNPQMDSACALPCRVANPVL